MHAVSSGFVTRSDSGEWVRNLIRENPLEALDDERTGQWKTLNLGYAGRKFQDHPIVSMRLECIPGFKQRLQRERIRGPAFAQAEYVGHPRPHSSCVTVTLVASVSGTSSIVAREALSFGHCEVLLKDSWRLKPQDLPLER